MSRIRNTAAWADAIREHGWPEGMERFAERLPEREKWDLKWELYARHTAWKALLDPDQRGAAAVVDGGCGTAVVSLARDFTRVHAIGDDANRLYAIAARARWLGLDNVIPHLAGAPPEAPIEPGSLDLAVFHDPRRVTRAMVATARSWLHARGSLYAAINRRLALDVWRALRPRVQIFAYAAPIARSYGLVPLSAAGLLHAPAFGLLAEPEGARSLARRVLQAVEMQAGLESLVLERLVFANPNGCTLIARESGGARVVVRIALDEVAARRFRANHESIQALRRRGAAVPEAVAAGRLHGAEFFAESAIEGRPARRADAAFLNTAMTWIARLHHDTARPRTMGTDEIERLVLKPMRLAAQTLREGREQALLAAMERTLVEAFHGRRVNLVHAHGDYSIDNIMLTRTGAVAGVFDWDLSDPQGLPLLDALYFVSTRRGGAAFAEKVLKLQFDPGERDALERYRTVLQVPAALVPALAVLAWARHVGERTAHPERYRFASDTAALDDVAALVSRVRQSSLATPAGGPR